MRTFSILYTRVRLVSDIRVDLLPQTLEEPRSPTWGHGGELDDVQRRVLGPENQQTICRRLLTQSPFPAACQGPRCLPTARPPRPWPLQVGKPYPGQRTHMYAHSNHQRPGCTSPPVPGLRSWNVHRRSCNGECCSTYPGAAADAGTFSRLIRTIATGLLLATISELSRSSFGNTG
jgi:hypothetical protein